ncbi:hypothetical protein EOPP23_10960 [Endozoicomonas sp. OPT23]|uniref:trypsin-like serine protease n=1 Tax=Endozoicomonas sp. OPT23 TaxID=2072845 RepID=UPI00129B79A4|nr:trypsin-like serine protease [Endozoicomonas sp. OPT23]MRI33505.1 hypothetical protein [Endozoicomonas sp. OPT23]
MIVANSLNNILIKTTLYFGLSISLSVHANDIEPRTEEDLRNWQFFIETPDNQLEHNCSGIAIADDLILTVDYCVPKSYTGSPHDTSTMVSVIKSDSNDRTAFKARNVKYLTLNSQSGSDYAGVALISLAETSLAESMSFDKLPVIAFQEPDKVSEKDQWQACYTEKQQASPPLLPSYNIQLVLLMAMSLNDCQDHHKKHQPLTFCALPDFYPIQAKFIHGAPLFNMKGELIAIGYNREQFNHDGIESSLAFSFFIPLGYFSEELSEALMQHYAPSVNQKKWKRTKGSPDNPEFCINPESSSI